MPESSLSPSALWAVGATAALCMLVTHLLMRKLDDDDEKRHRVNRRRRSNRLLVDARDDDSSFEEDVTTPPPLPHPSARRLKPPTPSGHSRSPSKQLSRSSNSPRPLDDDVLFSGGQWGFSMEDALKAADQMASAKENKTPQTVLEDLQKGNARFWTGTASRPESSAFDRRALIKNQYPSVAILGCADSRVPVEIVFDQGLGDMFVIRVAGNILGTSVTASLQYAIEHLKVKVVIIMGHEGCGAVKASLRPDAEVDQHPKELSQMLYKIKGNLNQESLSVIKDSRARDREAVVENVQSQVVLLTQDHRVMEKVNNQELIVVGAFYEISSGIVDFFYEVSSKHNIGPQPGCLDRVNSESLQPESPKRHSTEESKGSGGATPSVRGVQSRFDPSTNEVTDAPQPQFFLNSLPLNSVHSTV